ncbi:MAG: hypothetical protein AB7U07_01895 [Thermoleophilia bacterium]
MGAPAISTGISPPRSPATARTGAAISAPPAHANATRERMDPGAERDVDVQAAEQDGAEDDAEHPGA